MSLLGAAGGPSGMMGGPGGFGMAPNLPPGGPIGAPGGAGMAPSIPVAPGGPGGPGMAPPVGGAMPVGTTAAMNPTLLQFIMNNMTRAGIDNAQRTRVPNTLGGPAVPPEVVAILSNPLAGASVRRRR